MNYYLGEMPDKDSQFVRTMKRIGWIALIIFDIFALWLLRIYNII